MNNQTAVTVFDGMRPTPTENQDEIRKQFEALMKRGAVSIIITAECADGKAVTFAAGPPVGLLALAQFGVLQIKDMLSRKTGENG